MNFSEQDTRMLEELAFLRAGFIQEVSFRPDGSPLAAPPDLDAAEGA
jgi:hypothetical protein